MPMKKVLIANRGEIALRIIRTLRKMDIASVAVHADCDADSPFVHQANEAYPLNGNAPKDSYLKGDKILEIAMSSGCDGIHPGYGFLSENSDFAEKVATAGIKFIGPSIEAINVMGDKIDSKRAVSKFDVPMVPGTQDAVKDALEGQKIAKEIGYPVIVKASAGGGGKGMRVVNSETEFEELFERAVSEAETSFGNGTVFIEKFVEDPKHIEIQILADQHGNIIHLNERECSVQRRHQKVLEEAPSPIVTNDLRQRMGAAAINVARACNYEGVGTVEFLVNKNLEFFFLEMNTRIQVEHPVTEQTTGLDLIELQIRAAMGEELSIKQDDVQINGHSIELRIYAEDPENNFLPDLGKLSIYKIPKGIGIRVDDGYEQGMEIPIYFDSMIAKLIVHGKDRAEAIEKMRMAIDNFEISGLSTTLGFGRFVLNHPVFLDGSFTIKFVEDHFEKSLLLEEADHDLSIASWSIFRKLKKENLRRPIAQNYSSWRGRTFMDD